MKIQSINFAQSGASYSRVNFKRESTKVYDALAGQACSHIEKAKESLTRHVAELAEKHDYMGVIEGKKNLINLIRNDGRTKAEQDHDIYMLRQGIKEYVDKL